MTSTPTLRQNHFRIRLDGKLVTATPTWAAAQDIFPFPGLDTMFRLRIAIDNTGAGASGTLQFQCAKNGGTYQAVTTTSTIARNLDACANGVNTSGVATTNFGCSAGSGTAVAGSYSDGSGTGNAGSIAAGSYSEHEWAVYLQSADLAPGDYVDFRLTNAGTAFATYNVIPRIYIPRADTAPSGTTTYFFSNAASDLTATGQTGTAVSKSLVTSGASSGTFAPTLTANSGSVADNAADASFFAPASIPTGNNDHLYSTVSVSITTGNSNIRYSARLIRVSSTGTVLAWGPASAYTTSGATATYTFNCSWFGLGTWASGDRLRVDVRMHNSQLNTAGQTATLTYDANSWVAFRTTSPAVTWNLSDKNAAWTLSNGNLTATMGTATDVLVRATRTVATGYFEITFGTLSGGNSEGIGLANYTAPLNTYTGGGILSQSEGLFNNGTIFINSAQLGSSVSTWTAGDVMGVELTSTPSIKFYKNGTLLVTETTIPTGDLYPAMSGGNSGDAATANFGATTMSYLPVGVTSWDGSQTGSVSNVGAASGAGTATGVGKSIFSAVGASAGVATVTGASPPAAAWNSADKYASIVLSNNDLTASLTSALGNPPTDVIARGNTTRTAGYFEITFGTLVTGAAHNAGVGLANLSESLSANYLGGTSNSIGYFADGYYQYPGAASGTAATYAVGDVIGVELTASVAKFTKNGVLQFTANAGLPSGNIYPAISLANNTDSGTVNFGASAMSYLPAGVTSWDGTQTGSTGTSSGSAAGAGTATGVGKAIFNAVGASAGVATVTAVGASTFNAVGASAGVGTATGIGASTFRAVGASAGVGTATGVGASTFRAVGASAGVSTVSAVGAATANSVAASAGVATVTAVGVSTFNAVGASAGTSTVSAVGNALIPAIGSSAGVGTATGVGLAATGSIGASSGAGTATGVGAAIFNAVGASAGAATVTAVSASIANSVAVSAGAATVASVGKSTANSVAASAGAGTAAGVGQAIFNAVGVSAGISTVSAVGASTSRAVAASAGVSTVNAVGASTANSVAASTGASTVTAVGASTFRAVGTSAGTSTATGVNGNVGVAVGIGTAAGVGKAIFNAVSASAGVSTVSAISGGILQSVGASVGIGTSAGIGASTVNSVAASAGAGTATGVGTGAGVNIGSAAGVGTATGVGTAIFNAVGASAGASTVTAVGVATSLVTWNPSDKYPSIALSNGDLTASLTSALGNPPTDVIARGNIARTAGYFEITFGTIITGVHNAGVGLANLSESLSANYLGGSQNSIGYYANGYYQFPGGSGTFGPTFAAGDVMGIELTASVANFYKNGTLIFTANAGLPSGDIYPAISLANNTDSGTANFGASPMAYLPAGVTSWDGSQIGANVVSGVGTAAGASTAAARYSLTVSAVGASAGTSTVQARGTIPISATATAAGSSDGAAVGLSGAAVQAVGTSAGISTTNAVGVTATAVEAVGTAVGVSTCTAVGIGITFVTATGAALGVSHVHGVSLYSLNIGDKFTSTRYLRVPVMDDIPTVPEINRKAA